MAPLKRLLQSAVLRRTLCWIVHVYIRLVFVTSRWSTEGGEIAAALTAAGSPFIAAFWHGRLLMMPLMWQRRGNLHMLVSGHRDGRIIAGAIAYFGIDSIAGSSNTGGSAALRLMMRQIRAGDCVGITPDGPDGPAMRASAGIVGAARLAQVPVVPVTYATSRRRILDTWDRFHLPLPLSRGVFVWGEPIRVPPHMSATDGEQWRRLIEERMNALTAMADRRVGCEAPAPGTLARSEWRRHRHAADSRAIDSRG